MWILYDALLCFPAQQDEVDGRRRWTRLMGDVDRVNE
jgi:hypothetical protein